MSIVRSVSAILSVGLWISAVASARPMTPVPLDEVAITPPAGVAAPETCTPKFLRASVDPRQFGTQDRTITVLSGLQFYHPYSSVDQATLSLVPYGHSYTPLDLPAGAVIDYIGVNTATTVEAALGFTLHLRNQVNGRIELGSFSIPAHAGFATDYFGPLGILIAANANSAYVLDIEAAPGLQDPQYFGFVEIWWRRTVSDPPLTPAFGDVPVSHLFYQFIEALGESGITGGCGGGDYCPDALLTRGQMAVFLSKALGLHWPD